jgi:hypothetical protein
MSGRNTPREDAISKIFVQTVRFQNLSLRLDDLMVRGWEDDFCKGLIVLGPSGCGKTQGVKMWIKDRVAKEPKFKAVFSEVPSDCNLKSMAAQLLHDLGDPAFDHGSQAEKTLRITNGAQDCNVIVIDELQRLLEGKTANVRQSAASWLANLLNKKICPLLLIGELSAETVFDDSVYMKRRTLGQVPIEPYDWSNSQDRLEFRTFLNLFDNALGMSELSALGGLDTALRIHTYSLGRVGLAAPLIDTARLLARQAGRPKLTNDLFAQAVDRLRVGSDRRLENPFRAENPLNENLLPNCRDSSPVNSNRRRGSER